MGPTWSTHWLRVTCVVPADWLEVRNGGLQVPVLKEDLLLEFDSGGEALVYDQLGRTTQALNGTGRDAKPNESDRRSEVLICKRGEPLPPAFGLAGADSPTVRLWVEVACNGMFGADGGGIRPPKPDLTFSLHTCGLALSHRGGRDLLWDFVTCLGLVRALPAQGSSDSATLLAALHDCLNAFDRADDHTWPRARAALQGALAATRRGNATTAACLSGAGLDAVTASTRPIVFAVGHCHIDTAWLWPFAETRRKVRRSWAAQLRYMEGLSRAGLAGGRRLVFAASQAAQYQWLKEDDPELFSRLSRSTRTAQALMRSPAGRGELASSCAGRQKGLFVPVGGTWVEPDANMPSGESLLRQFHEGHLFFSEMQGCDPLQPPQRGDADLFFLPDTFGYSSQLPQLCRLVGRRWFVTQKLSWSLENKPKDSTFLWEGIDGSRLLTHFCPADTYCAHASAEEVYKSASANKDLGRAHASLLLYGWGDGGGGPTPQMLESLGRVGASAPASMPQLVADSPQAFFEAVEAQTGMAAPPALEGPGPAAGSRRRSPPAAGGGEAGVEARCGSALHAWRGELFLELHNGTYTSQAMCKKGNRQSEALLCSLEALRVWDALLAAGPPPSDPALQRCGHTAEATEVAPRSPTPLWAAAAQLASADRVEAPTAPSASAAPAPTTAAADAAAAAAAAPASAAAGSCWDDLREMWREMLLLQFHDVLPGSSIAVVHRVTEAQYDRLMRRGWALAARLGRHVLAASGKQRLLFNGTGHWRREWVFLPAAAAAGGDGVRALFAGSGAVAPWAVDLAEPLGSGAPGATEFTGEEDPGRCAAMAAASPLEDEASWQPHLVQLPPFGFAAPGPPPLAATLELQSDEGEVVVSNDAISLTISKATGHILSLRHLSSGREAVPPGQEGGRLLLHADVPFFWGAWDTMQHHLQSYTVLGTGRHHPTADPADPAVRDRLLPRPTSNEHAAAGGEGRPAVVVTHRLRPGVAAQIDVAIGPFGAGGSSLRQRLTVFAGEQPMVEAAFDVDWRERNCMLKYEMPVDVNAPEAAFETAFGITRRPTHNNTSRDAMQYEVCGHRFADLSEPGFGLSVLSDSKYGFSIKGDVIRVSLLRAPTRPDPRADEGRHTFRLALLPHSDGLVDTVARAAAFNSPLLLFDRQAVDAAAAAGTSASVPSAAAGAAASVPSAAAGAAASVPSAAAAGLLRVEVPTARQRRSYPYSAGPNTGVVVDNIKLAMSQRSSGVAVTARVYESVGARGRVVLRCARRVLRAVVTDALERPAGPRDGTLAGEDSRRMMGLGGLLPQTSGTEVVLDMRPFQVCTVRLDLEQ